MATPELILHGLAPSHPCLTAEAALRYKELEYERIDFNPGQHVEEMQRIYGEGHSTVPGLLVDGEPVHGSRAILARLEQLAPAPPLYPESIGDAVREAERWGDEELQDLGRRLPWGALHFRPGARHVRRRRRPRSRRDRLRDQGHPRELALSQAYGGAPG